MAIQKYTNNAVDTLNGAITNVQTTITLNDASEFPSIGAGEQYYATITDGTNIEIVLVTDDASTPTLTVTRGQQGTSGTAFADGTTVSHRYTAADGDNWVQRADTGSVDLSGATEFKIPTDAAPTVNADGEIALDTTVTDFSHGVVKYYGGEEMGVIAMPIAQFTTPTDAYVVSYNATNDEFELVAQTGGGISAVVDDTTPQLGGDLDVNGNQITGAIDFDSTGNIEMRLGDNAGLDRVRIRDSDDTVVALIDSDGNMSANGAVDFGGSTSLEIPNSASPTVNAAGEVAVDTSITDYTGMIKYYDGVEELVVAGMPTANLSTTDRDKIVYDAANNELKMEGFVGFRAQRSTAQTITTATYTKVQLNSEAYDTEGDFDSTTNYRHTPTIGGKWLYIAVTSITSLAADKQLITAIYKNSSPNTESIILTPYSVSCWVQCATVIEMNGTTDYVELYMRHDHGSDRDTQPASSVNFLIGIKL